MQMDSDFIILMNLNVMYKYANANVHTCCRNLHLDHLGIFIAVCSLILCLGRLHESATRWSIHSRVLWDKQDLRLHSNTSHWCHYHKSDVFWICRTQKVMRAFTCENRFLQVFHDKFIQDSLTGATPKDFILLDEDEWGRFYIFGVVSFFQSVWMLLLWWFVLQLNRRTCCSASSWLERKQLRVPGCGLSVAMLPTPSAELMQ